jgi:hypothetical protein
MSVSTSMHQWLTKAKKTYPFFDGFFLSAVFDGNFWIWPPSLEFYPCPEQLTKAKDSVAIAWDQPSFLRICRRTLMPYHGYVVPSPVHDRIYAYLKTQIPQHVTVLPILNKDQLIALFYMEAKTVDTLSEIPSLSSLELKWENLAFEFSSLYKLKRTGIISSQRS